MTIKAGDKMPAGVFTIPGPDGPQSSRPNSCSPARRSCCSRSRRVHANLRRTHLPGFVQHSADFKAKGVDTVACMAVNDVFVMKAWGKASAVEGTVLMLADGNGDYAKALGLELDATGFGMGMRGKRFAIIVQDGVAQNVLVEGRASSRSRAPSTSSAALTQSGADRAGVAAAVRRSPLDPTPSAPDGYASAAQLLLELRHDREQVAHETDVRPPRRSAPRRPC